MALSQVRHIQEKRLSGRSLGSGNCSWGGRLPRRGGPDDTAPTAPAARPDARAVGYSVFTEDETLEELKAMVQDAVRCHFEDEPMPKLIRLHFVRDEVIPA